MSEPLEPSTFCFPSSHQTAKAGLDRLFPGSPLQAPTQTDATGYTARMSPARQQISIYLLIGFGLGCGHVEPSPQPDDSKTRLVVDSDYFETHPESMAAWTLYAMQRKAMPGAGEYEIEVEGRRTMVDYWREEGTSGADRYLDLMVTVEELGFLEEYVIAAFSRPGWTVPAAAMADLDIPTFFAWAEENLQGHVGEARAFLEHPHREAPGALYPPPETFVDANGPRCDKKKQLDAVLDQWEVDRRALIGRLLAVPDGVEFLYYLDEIGTKGDLGRTGATQVPPSLVDLLFIGGYCATERVDLKAAQRYFEDASSLDPFNASVRLELAHVLIQKRKFEPAEEQIEIVLANSQDPCMIARALRKRGFIEFERGELIQAYTTYTESLDHEPGSELARSELSLIYQTMEAQGFEDLPPPEYVPPPSEQMTTQCTL